MSKRCGRLMKSLGCVQAIEGSPWLCLHIGSIINEMVEKDANGQVILSAEHATGPTFNIEDLINSLQLFSDLVSRLQNWLECMICDQAHDFSVRKKSVCTRHATLFWGENR